MGDETEDILEKVANLTERLHEDKDFRSTVATRLYELGYIEAQNVNNDGAGGNIPKFNTEQVHYLFVKAVNMSMTYTVDLRKDDPLLMQKLKKLLVDTLPSYIRKRQIEHYLKNTLPDRSIQNNLKSPLDFLKEGCIKPSATQTFFIQLIECQFHMKWNTTTAEAGISGRPVPFNYYEFCNEEKKIWPRTELKSLNNRVRRTHVLVQLFQMPVAVLSQELSSDDLCPSVYIRTDKKKWKNWNPTSKKFGETINLGEGTNPFPWMNNSIRNYILDQAQIIPDADCKACLDRYTLYWAVIHDSDFQTGDKLKLNNIGRTQVYVGKANKGINGRWLLGHCKNMMECLKDVRRMKKVGAYQPLKDVQLVEARLVLAKLRANEKSALFVMKTFDHDIEEATNAFNLAQETYDAEEIPQNKRRLDKAKEDLEIAEKKAEKDLIEAESRNIQGMRIRKFKRKESNYIIQDEICRVRPRWQPLDMRYGMNSRK
ncbi:Hypothetical predicted protein [Paramuricea clavata]|uniref:Uncharacterized protein n=1 Tax=Paramuricea clavata TaxID=317549 RepID=A0A7D9IGQ8_PARCT|nr:Hypothetical predicted protein [Paramuricea clavata]